MALSVLVCYVPKREATYCNQWKHLTVGVDVIGNGQSRCCLINKGGQTLGPWNMSYPDIYFVIIFLICNKFAVKLLWFCLISFIFVFITRSNLQEDQSHKKGEKVQGEVFILISS